MKRRTKSLTAALLALTLLASLLLPLSKFFSMQKSVFFKP